MPKRKALRKSRSKYSLRHKGAKAATKPLRRRHTRAAKKARKRAG